VERPSRHAMLGVRNGEIVGDRGGLSDASAAKQPLAAQAGRSFRRLCSETIPRKGGVTVKLAGLIGAANDKTVSGGQHSLWGVNRDPGSVIAPVLPLSSSQKTEAVATAGVTFPARDTTAHGRYKGMRLNSATR
jgi:hypothetical protein